MSFPIEPIQNRPRTTLAPAWHTVTVVAILIGVVVVGQLGLIAPGSARTRHIDLRVISYAITFLFEWLLLAFIVFASPRDMTLRALIGGRWQGWRDVVRDLSLAVGFLLVSDFVLALLRAVLNSTSSAALENLVPVGAVQIAVFLVLAATAAICEEVIFRGYLQRQFAAWTGSATVGILLQAILFGISHAYQGGIMIVIIAIYGGFFGVLALWRGSLRPGMLAHFLQDGIAGLALAFYLAK